MDKEQLIAEVVRQTGIRLEPTDPVIALGAINGILLDEALVKSDRHVKAQADRITAASAQAVSDAKKEAEALLSEGGEWAEARIKAVCETAGAEVLANLRQETAKAERAHRATVRVAWLTAVIGLLIVSGLSGIALATIGHP
jgi:ribosomal protein L12E/L44/L45/RPP1/RPP2